MHRGEPDGKGHNLSTRTGRLEAISEATGPEGEWGKGQFEDIAEIYERPSTDRSYWERVQLNLWLQANSQAFDPVRQADLIDTEHPNRLIPFGSLVTAGFDGARFKDSTAIVITDVLTGRQQLWGLWERPPDVDEWEVDEAEVTASVDLLMTGYEVYRFNADPPHWTETVGSWAGKWPVVEEWWTTRHKPMAYACRSYREAMSTGAVSYVSDDRRAVGSVVKDETLTGALTRHIAAAGRVDLNLWDDENESPLWILGKLHRERKFDACMAAVLSWEGRLAALADEKLNKRRTGKAKRLY